MAKRFYQGSNYIHEIFGIKQLYKFKYEPGSDTMSEAR